MFNISNVLKRAWHILWNYKVLWVFAFLLAISGGAGNGGGGGGGGSGARGSSANFTPGGSGDFSARMPQWMQTMGEWVKANVAPYFATEELALRSAILIGVTIFLIAVICGLLLSLVRYPSETAVIRMVDEHESTGIKYRFKEGWKLGWNRRAFRLWLVDLLIGIPAASVIMLLVGLLVFFGVSIFRSRGGQLVAGEIIGIVFVVLFLMLFTFVMVVVSLLRNYVVRFAAIDGADVKTSFRSGWKMFKSNLKNTILMALVLFGLGIAFGIVALIAMFLLIPAYAILAIPGAIAAVIPGGIAYFITSLFNTGVLPWIIAGVVALPLFFLVVFSPISLISGLFAVYTSNIWTLMFRQFKAALTPPPLVVAETPQE